MKRIKYISCFVCLLTIICVTATNTVAVNLPAVLDHELIAGESNPDDAIDYIIVSDNDKNGLDYAFQVDGDFIEIEPTDSDIPTEGDILIDGDYMYVYGYYYTGTEIVATASLDGWIKQPTVTGWGCAVTDKTKQTYEPPCGVINEEPVTCMANLYYNCSNMLELPCLPNTAQIVDNLCNGCSSLTTANFALGGLALIGENSFSGCSSLKYVYIPVSVVNIDEMAFRGAYTNCVISVQSVSSGADWEPLWNFETSTTEHETSFAIDYMVWLDSFYEGNA